MCLNMADKDLVQKDARHQNSWRKGHGHGGQVVQLPLLQIDWQLASDATPTVLRLLSKKNERAHG